VRRLVPLLAAGLVLAACGEEPRPASEPRVRLKLDVPSDGRSVRADHVAVSGTVTPGDAAVRIAGADAEVDGGQFTAEVALEPGGNVIDITATAPGRRAATDAVRVMRDMRVEVPQLVGDEVEAALAALGDRDLRAVEERGGSWLDRLIPGPVTVCAMRPRAGTLVEPRSQVVLETGRDC
jgi:hypothetical protein